MAGLDLKPLNNEAIKEMGINAHDLWHIQLGGEEFGPFETESLKHYAGENGELFEEALATRQDNNDWRPFYSHTLFQRRGPQVLKPKAKQEGPYWILDNGQKLGPFSASDIDKKIELISLGFTDLISTDDGHSWYKLYQIHDFDRRFHSASELPFSPAESEFQKARIELLEKIESHSDLIKPSESLAEMAHHTQLSGKVIRFRPEDFPLRPAGDASVSSNLNWQVPLAVALVVTLVAGVRFIVTSSPDQVQDQIAESSGVGGEKSKTLSHAEDPSRIPSPQNSHNRSPANYPSPSTHMPNFTPPNYNTQIETHHNDYPPENDHYQDASTDENREPASEQNLVPGDPASSQEGHSLDAAMGNPQPEEVSDF